MSVCPLAPSIPLPVYLISNPHFIKLLLSFQWTDEETETTDQSIIKFIIKMTRRKKNIPQDAINNSKKYLLQGFALNRRVTLYLKFEPGKLRDMDMAKQWLLIAHSVEAKMSRS